MSTANEFEAETRERLATVEQQQDNVNYRLQRLQKGQDEIMSKIEELRVNVVIEDDIEDLEDESIKNTSSRYRKEGAMKVALLLGSIVSGASGYVVGVML